MVAGFYTTAAGTESGARACFGSIRGIAASPAEIYRLIK
jgi:hypothetical protein